MRKIIKTLIISLVMIAIIFINAKEVVANNDNYVEVIDEVINFFEELVVETEEVNESLISINVLYDSSTKTYMDFRLITSKSSPQYNYIYNLGLIEFCNDGHLREDEYIGVALGSYFGNIGDKFIFKLDSGIELKLIKLDEKNDNHTIDGFIHNEDESVIEFVINEDLMEDKRAENGYIYGGNFNNAQQYKGKIIEIWKVVN